MTTLTASQTARNYGAAFNALRSARQSRMFFRRAELLLKAAALYRSIGDARLADSLDALAEIPNFADFQQAANA